MYALIKILTSSLIIFAVGELSKKSSLLASLLISLPLVSILSFIWIYFESKNTVKIATMSYEVFWLVLPSLAFFLILPFMINKGFSFILSMLMAVCFTSVFYLIALYFINHFKN